MKIIRLFDICIQLIICFFTVQWIAEHFKPENWALIGLWQLFSFTVVSWKYSNKYLRGVYLLSLFIVLFPTYVKRDLITDHMYYHFICPMVAVYYLIVCILEYIQIDKKINQINNPPNAVFN
jgi:hypothetical protein